MRYTLLQLVQRILESMDSDEVNTIGGSPESVAVANIVKENYFNIIGDMDLPNQSSLFQMTPSNDSDLPCLMYLPENVVDIEWLKYNNATIDNPTFVDVVFMPFRDYVNYIDNLDAAADTTVSTMEVPLSTGTFTFKFKTNIDPTYYTTFDDHTVIFDSYDSSKEQTLQAVKTMSHGMLVPTFSMTDNFVPHLEPRQFQLLLQASKAQAFVEEKQIENPNAKAKERKNTILTQRTKNAIDRRTGNQTYKAYGRK